MRTVCLDFDGVMNTYDGWAGEEELFYPRRGLGGFLLALTGAGWQVVVHSTRDPQRISEWLARFGFAHLVHRVCREKPPAVVYVDNRSVRFDGDFATTLNQIYVFRAYWEKPQ